MAKLKKNKKILQRIKKIKKMELNGKVDWEIDYSEFSNRHFKNKI
ncbi:MAG: hypothetical protein U9O55_02355 [Patescibacteria group bacterium]|nr:hypothetical protein [Patescibacteria group bacterium]